MSFCKNLVKALQVQWIPRTENEAVDSSSWEIDPDDWRVAQDFFHIIDRMWGPHTVDRFADDCNTKLAKFNPKAVIISVIHFLLSETNCFIDL